MENEEEIMAEQLVQVQRCEFKDAQSLTVMKSRNRKTEKKTDSINHQSTDTLVDDSKSKKNILKSK